MDGNASRIRIIVISDIQQKIGIRMKPMPGARMFRMVTKKFSAAAIEATPRICKPSIQKSMPGPGEYVRVVRLA